MTAVKPEERRRIAHPHDPLLGGEWAAWRRHCSQTEREQPFEQVFRELHLPTEQERRAGVVSRRYAGRPVNPAQARELLGERGWWTRDEVSRTFYEAGLTATVTFRPAGRAPGEGEALDGVQFTRRGESVPTPLEDVPPCVFSEVMRDLDLVVSAEIRGE
jgi:hypothetical protein